MLKISVRPLAIRNSSMPNCTPFKIEMMTSSSTGYQALRAWAFHLADGRQNGVCGIDLGDYAPAPSGLFLIERLVCCKFAERLDVHGLKELVIGGPHEPLTAVEHGHLHVLKLQGDLARIGRFRLLDRGDKHAHLIDDARIQQSDVVFRAQRLLDLLGWRIRDVG